MLVSREDAERVASHEQGVVETPSRQALAYTVVSLYDKLARIKHLVDQFETGNLSSPSVAALLAVEQQVTNEQCRLATQHSLDRGPCPYCDWSPNECEVCEGTPCRCIQND